MQFAQRIVRFRLFNWLVCACLAMTSGPFAQAAVLSYMPEPSQRIALSPIYDLPLLKGLVFSADSPFYFTFLIQRGNIAREEALIRLEVDKIAKYFLAALTLPGDDLWVNLSPYEKDRISTDNLAMTDLGKDMLGEDYVLKQFVASITYPEEGPGKEFWSKVYKRLEQKFGTAKIPVNTFQKVWIMPDKIKVVEGPDRAMIESARLKVMMDDDYLAMSKNTAGVTSGRDKQAKDISNQAMREVIIPLIEQEVNEGKHFAHLRQIYHAIVLANWFKEKLKDTILNRVYFGKARLKGCDVVDPQIREKIYNVYTQAFRRGVYNYIKTEAVPGNPFKKYRRQYISGGAVATTAVMRQSTQFTSNPAAARAMTESATPANGYIRADEGLGPLGLDGSFTMLPSGRSREGGTLTSQGEMFRTMRAVDAGARPDTGMVADENVPAAVRSAIRVLLQPTRYTQDPLAGAFETYEKSLSGSAGRAVINRAYQNMLAAINSPQAVQGAAPYLDTRGIEAAISATLQEGLKNDLVSTAKRNALDAAAKEIVAVILDAKKRGGGLAGLSKLERQILDRMLGTDLFGDARKYSVPNAHLAVVLAKIMPSADAQIRLGLAQAALQLDWDRRQKLYQELTTAFAQDVRENAAMAQQVSAGPAGIGITPEIKRQLKDGGYLSEIQLPGEDKIFIIDFNPDYTRRISGTLTKTSVRGVPRRATTSPTQSISHDEARAYQAAIDAFRKNRRQSDFPPISTQTEQLLTARYVDRGEKSFYVKRDVVLSNPKGLSFERDEYSNRNEAYRRAYDRFRATQQYTRAYRRVLDEIDRLVPGVDKRDAAKAARRIADNQVAASFLGQRVEQADLSDIRDPRLQAALGGIYHGMLGMGGLNHPGNQPGVDGQVAANPGGLDFAASQKMEVAVQAGGLQFSGDKAMAYLEEGQVAGFKLATLKLTF